MKTRGEIKAIALQNFKANYWEGVGILFLLSVVSGIMLGTGVGFIVAPAFAVSTAFFSIALYFGDKRNTDISTSFSVGFSEFGRNLGCLLLKAVFLSLWSMLAYIPGVIMSYAYAMTEYILADCPAVRAMDAIKISKKMMKGHKWELFVFDLSFIGWFWLSGLTGGLLYIFYVGPYYKSARAGYYTELKKMCIATGVVSEYEFGGAPAPAIEAYGTPSYPAPMGGSGYPATERMDYDSPAGTYENHTEMINYGSEYSTPDYAPPVGGPIISINPNPVSDVVGGNIAPTSFGGAYPTSDSFETGFPESAPYGSGISIPAAGGDELKTSFVAPAYSAPAYSAPAYSAPVVDSFVAPPTPTPDFGTPAFAPEPPASTPRYEAASTGSSYDSFAASTGSSFDSFTASTGSSVDSFATPTASSGLKGKMVRNGSDSEPGHKGSDEEMASSGFKRPTDF